ncbi:hypothetical protein EG329_008672 [Mollisiaceae sp. DMI_Dod_QoI]|nr:hypothetical protein EG329_008672 [Helotiales sp. DMI_Dod_QoI]
MPLKAEGSAVGKQVKPETPEPATPKLVPKLTPQDTKNESDDEDDDGDTRMKDLLEFRIKTTRLVKVATPPIFRGKPSELKKQGKRKPQNKGQTKKKEGSCYNCGKAGHWAKECKALKKQTAATAGKAVKAPKEKKTKAAGPKGLLEKPLTEKDYQDWERENWQLEESIKPLEKWIKISTTDEKYAKYKRTLTAEIQGLKNETRTTPDKQEETYY